MDYRRFGDTYVVRLDRGEEVLAGLTELCRREDVRLASVEGIGAVDHAEVALYDVPTRTFFKKQFDEPMEISQLSGTVTRRDGAPYLHLHATLCDRELTAHGGHVQALNISATCEIVLRLIPGEVGRMTDEKTGLNLFRFD